jgi:hypothetical protein
VRVLLVWVALVLGSWALVLTVAVLLAVGIQTLLDRMF